MFKIVFPAIMCLALCCPMVSSAQDCGCATPAPAPCCEPAPAPCCEPAPVCCEPAPAPCVKTRKRLALVDVSRNVSRFKVVCGTDCCGCPTKKRVRVSECVTRKKLTLVDVEVDPCKRGPLAKIGGRLRGLGSKLGGCCAPDPCCPAPAPCGCN